MNDLNTFKQTTMVASKLEEILIKKNSHERDKNISFQEEGHKYTIHTDLESKYTSVTTLESSSFSKI